MNKIRKIKRNQNKAYMQKEQLSFDMNLKKKVRDSFLWVTLTNMIVRGIGFCITIFLARLLLPEAFGLVAIAMLIIAFFSLFQDLGISAALIYRKTKIKEAANSAFFLNLILSFIFFILVCLSADYVATFFGTREAVLVIKVLSVTFVILSLGAIQSVLLEKELEFKKKFWVETIPILMYGGVALVLAVNGQGVWSLVFAYLSQVLIQTILLWFLSTWRPSFSFSWKITKELLDYGKYVLGFNLLAYGGAKGDSLVVGKLLSTTSLGFYTLAYSIASLPATSFSQVISKVTFPTYSKLKDKMDVLKSAYLKVLTLSAVIIIPVNLGLFVLAPEIVHALLGEKWLPIVPVLQVLCFFGILRALGGTTGPVFYSVGKPKMLFKLNLFALTVLAILLYPLTSKYGILGAGIAALISTVIANTWAFFKVAKILKITLKEIIKGVCLAITCSIVMILVVYSLKLLLSMSLTNLIILIVLGIISYFLPLMILGRQLIKDIKILIKT